MAKYDLYQSVETPAKLLSESVAFVFYRFLQIGGSEKPFDIQERVKAVEAVSVKDINEVK